MPFVLFHDVSNPFAAVAKRKGEETAEGEGVEVGEKGESSEEDGFGILGSQVAAEWSECDGSEENNECLGGALVFYQEIPEEEGPEEVELFFDREAPDVLGDLGRFDKVDEIGKEGEPAFSMDLEWSEELEDGDHKQEGDVGRENAQGAADVKEAQADISKFEFLLEEEEGDEKSAENEEDLHAGGTGRDPADKWIEFGRGVVNHIAGVCDEHQEYAQAAESIEARKPAIVRDFFWKLQIHDNPEASFHASPKYHGLLSET